MVPPSKFMVKDLVIGLGEIGSPILRLLSKCSRVTGYDIKTKLMDSDRYQRLKDEKTMFLHVCIPYSKNFFNILVKCARKHKPEALVIHSTVKPHTTERLQKKLDLPIIYSATRGVHSRMLKDLKRYTKFYSLYDWAPRSKWASKKYKERMKKAGIKTKKMSSPLVLELAKIIVDTSYYAWLINYAQLSNMISIKHKVDYDEMWSFADEIHKFLGNRPKMFPGFIGGHCLIPNLDLMHNQTLNLIKEMNSAYARKVKDAKSIVKK